MADVEWLTHADFADRMGEEFEVPDVGLVLALAEATESSEPGGPGPDGRTRNQFSLVFTRSARPDDGAGHVSGSCTPSSASGDLFLVPLGPQGDAMRYEAAFA